MAKEDGGLEKVQISGPTIASLLQRFTSSPGNIHGLLFGHVTHLSPSHLSDDLSTTTTTTATITSLISTTTSHYNHNHNNILNQHQHHHVIGWFSGRRRTQLRPSLRETSITASLARKHSPCIFLLLTSPPPSSPHHHHPNPNPNPNTNTNNNNNNNNNAIHTHEYTAYHFVTTSSKFLPKTLDVVNIGPAFRRHYGSFSPASPFPALPCHFNGSDSMAEEEDDHPASSSKETLDGMGIDVRRLSRLIGPEAVKYTAELEDTYKGMLARLGDLAMLVDESSARVAKQLQKCPDAQISTSQNDITRVALDAQPGKGEESESKKQREVMTYQRRRKRDMVPVREPPASTKVERFPSIGSSIEPRKSDEVKMKTVDEKGEKVSPSGLSRIGPNFTSPEEDSTPVIGSVQDPDMKAIKGWDGCAAPHLGYESRVNMNSSILQDRLPHAGNIGMGKTELVEQCRLTTSASGTELTSPLRSQVRSCQLSIEHHHSDNMYPLVSYPRDTSSGVTDQPLVSSSLDISQTHRDSSFGYGEERAKCVAGDNFS